MDNKAEVPGAIVNNTGKLYVVNDNQVHLEVGLGENEELSLIHLDTGSSYSQINSNRAMLYGLKSHSSLIGISQIGDGSEKYNYLSQLDVSIAGVRSKLLVKVAPDQPNVLGLDAVIRFHIIPDAVRCTFTSCAKEGLTTKHWFKFLNWEKIMESIGLTERDLVPIDQLPSPKSSYAKLVKAGRSHCVLNLGPTSSGLYLPQTLQPRLLYLGTS
ncbi:hypothetical protein BC833DRAFT_622714 [Globomyces pollinis-pini]|nr:hypothetical protein BC833DRAFT_622714 [Globomyces pollinis-pini]KAJ2994604.1 hypothetical protein HDV02_001463 [Globomyces sp. JEL0801]